jgi:hypothetical protein
MIWLFGTSQDLPKAVVDIDLGTYRIWLALILFDQVKRSSASGYCKSQGVVDQLGMQRMSGPIRSYRLRHFPGDFAGTSSKFLLLAQCPLACN